MPGLPTRPAALQVVADRPAAPTGTAEAKPWRHPPDRRVGIIDTLAPRANREPAGGIATTSGRWMVRASSQSPINSSRLITGAVSGSTPISRFWMIFCNTATEFRVTSNLKRKRSNCASGSG